MEFPCLPHKSVQNSSVKSTNRARPNIMKNLLILCSGTAILFTAYDALTMLQSTMNHKDGVGVISQAVLYIFFCGSAILLPKICISKFGSKNTSVVAMFAYLPYIASNYYPHWTLMIPSSILLGIAGPLLWASHGVYLNGISGLYSTQEDEISLNYKSTKDNFKEKSCGDITYPPLCCQYSRRIPYNPQTPKIKQQPKNYFQSSLPDYRNSRVDRNVLTQENSEQNETKSLVAEPGRSATAAKFFGLHGMAHLSSHVWSNLMSYFTLKSDVSFSEFRNSSCRCGAEFCNVVSECFESNAGVPGANARVILTSICVCLCVISILLVGMFLDALEEEKRDKMFSFDSLSATCGILRRNELLLLIPLSVHTGLVQGFYVGDFNKSYVACAWGTYHVGLVAVCYGVACGVSSVLAGWCVKRCGRRLVFTSAAAVNAVSVILLLTWTPDAEFPQMFFFASGLWGIHVGIVWSQLRAFYGVLFKADDEAAFSAFHLWSGFGFCIAFGISNFFCISHKLYLILAVSVLGFSGYYTVEWIYCNNNKDVY